MQEFSCIISKYFLLIGIADSHSPNCLYCFSGIALSKLVVKRHVGPEQEMLGSEKGIKTL